MTSDHGRAPFLKRIKITCFGAFSEKVVGPFSPNLNVVYGRNEAGKTTLTSFVGGVLFGWEEARVTLISRRMQNAQGPCFLPIILATNQLMNWCYRALGISTAYRAPLS